MKLLLSEAVCDPGRCRFAGGDGEVCRPGEHQHDPGPAGPTQEGQHLDTPAQTDVPNGNDGHSRKQRAAGLTILALNIGPIGRFN